MIDTVAHKQVSIVTVTHNSASVLGAMLASVPEQTPVIVVDNASKDVDELRGLCARFGAILIENTTNQGFGTACNIGAAQADTEYIFFLNPDCTLLPDTLNALITTARGYPEAVGFSPRIENSSGKVFFRRKSVLIPRALWMPPGSPDNECIINMLSGAAFFVPRKVFELVAGFDPRIFLFHEDDDLAVRLNKHGALIFAHNARVYHQGGNSSGNSLETVAFKAWHAGYSRVYATQKHNRPGARSRTLVKALFKIISPKNLRSRRKMVENRAFLRGVLSAIFHRPAQSD